MNYDFSFVNTDFFGNFILKGLLFSLQLTFIAMVMGILLGTALALMRLSGKKALEIPAKIYVDTMRSIPLVMVILWVFLLIPILLGHPLEIEVKPFSIGGTEFNGFKIRAAELSAMLTFSLFEAAYYSEIMRAGIQSISKGQVNAGYAVGMNYAQCMKLIVLPQAFRNMLPVLLTQTLVLFQDTSLVYAIGAYDLFKGFDVAGKNFNRPQETILMCGVIYFIICFSLSMLVRRLQKRIQIIR
jgi:glutamate/aspartate transport system permease protein